MADRQGWGLGETLEHAVALLEGRFGTLGDDALQKLAIFKLTTGAVNGA